MVTLAHSSPAFSAIDSDKSPDTRKSEESNYAGSKTIEQHVDSKDEDREKISAIEEPDVIPNGGYGWVCVGTSFTINAHTWGMNSSYGVFLNYYLSTEAFPGATKLQYAFVGGLSMAVAMVLSPLITVSVRKFGTRATLMIGVFFQTISFIAASFSTAIWHLALSQGVCFAIGLGFLFIGSVGVIPQWFTTRRSLANGIAASGSGFGGLIYSLATNAMIQSLGLPWAFRILAIITFVVNFICAILLRDRNKQVGSVHMAFDFRLLKRYEFWLLQGYGFFSMLGYVILIFSIPNYGHVVGLTAKQSSTLGAILNLGQGLGRPPIGYFSDWIGRINMAGTMTFLSGVLVLVVWINAKSFGVLIFYVLIGGTVAGTYWATIAPVAVEVMDLKDLPSALSITWVFLTIPLLISEPIGLEIVAYNNGSYLGAQVFCGVMYIAAAICLWLLKAWKVGKLEQQAGSSSVTENTSSEPVTGGVYPRVGGQGTRSSFAVRLLKWKKV